MSSSWVTNFYSILTVYTANISMVMSIVGLILFRCGFFLQHLTMMMTMMQPTHNGNVLFLIFHWKQAKRVICGNSMSINVIIRSFCFMVNSIIWKFLRTTRSHSLSMWCAFIKAFICTLAIYIDALEQFKRHCCWWNHVYVPHFTHISTKK